LIKEWSGLMIFQTEIGKIWIKSAHLLRPGSKKDMQSFHAKNKRANEEVTSAWSEWLNDIR